MGHVSLKPWDRWALQDSSTRNEVVRSRSLMPFKDLLMYGSAASYQAAVEVDLTSAHMMRVWMSEPSSQEHELSPRGQGARQKQRPQGELL